MPLNSLEFLNWRISGYKRARRKGWHEVGQKRASAFSKLENHQ
ncbi:hypothetical protein VCSRO125_3004 [Vibrio cholerae]|nr:hypothetical protein VCSRO125_3004 [Vibrio cholerae]